jgi:hypothetical protein
MLRVLSFVEPRLVLPFACRWNARVRRASSWLCRAFGVGA